MRELRLFRIALLFGMLYSLVLLIWAMRSNIPNVYLGPLELPRWVDVPALVFMTGWFLHWLSRLPLQRRYVLTGLAIVVGLYSIHVVYNGPVVSRPLAMSLSDVGAVGLLLSVVLGRGTNTLTIFLSFALCYHLVVYMPHDYFLGLFSAALSTLTTGLLGLLLGAYIRKGVLRLNRLVPIWP